LNPTKNLKQLDVDPENFMHMRSPVITGRQSSVDSPGVENTRMDSPFRNNPSKFKQ